MGKLWKPKALAIRELTRRIGRGNWLLAVEVLDVAARQTTRYDVRAFNTALSACKVLVGDSRETYFGQPSGSCFEIHVRLKLGTLSQTLQRKDELQTDLHYPCQASSSGWLASSQFLEQLNKKGLEPSAPQRKVDNLNPLFCR